MTNKTCLVKGCKRTIEARNLCNMHYKRLLRTGEIGEAEPRKSPNGTFNRKEYYKKRKQWIKEKRKTDPDYGKSISSMHKGRFGGLRKKVLERDGYTCQACGMTDKEHLAEYDRHITIDHIDGQGRYSDTKNNQLNNLWTLCLACHGRRDIYRYWLSKGKAVPEDLVISLRLEDS